MRFSRFMRDLMLVTSEYQRFPDARTLSRSSSLSNCIAATIWSSVTWAPSGTRRASFFAAFTCSLVARLARETVCSSTPRMSICCTPAARSSSLRRSLSSVASIATISLAASMSHATRTGTMTSASCPLYIFDSAR